MSPQTDLALTVNGIQHVVAADAEDTLLDVLRRELQLFSCRETCGLGLCGSCTVIVGGKAVSSCLSLALAHPDADVTTAEGLVAGDALHPVQQAFVDAQAFQCSFCTPGFVMSVVAMLGEPREQRSVEDALSGHLCRCASYTQIREAVYRIVEAHAPDQEE